MLHKQSSDDPVRYRGFRVNYWTPDNQSNDYPAPAIKGTYTDFSNSDYFVKMSLLSVFQIFH